MAKIEAWLSCDLKKPVQVQGLSGNVFSMDNNGSRINVRIYDNGEKTTVSGSVTANCILADGSTINVNGSLTTDNGQSVAYVDIPQSCLLVPGPIRIAIKLTASGVITTLAAVVTTVYRTQTDIVITPSAQIITDWNAEISAAIATQNATIANQDTKINDLKSALTYEIRGEIDTASAFQQEMLEDAFNVSPTAMEKKFEVSQLPGFVNLSGVLTAHQSYSHTCPIDVEEGDIVKIVNANSQSVKMRFVTAYNYGVVDSSKGEEHISDTNPYTVPSGVNQVVISFFGDPHYSVVIKRNVNKITTLKDSSLVTDDKLATSNKSADGKATGTIITAVSKDVSAVKNEDLIYYPEYYLIAGKINKTDLSTVDADNYSISSLIPVMPGNMLTAQVTSGNAQASLITVYNKNRIVESSAARGAYSETETLDVYYNNTNEIKYVSVCGMSTHNIIIKGVNSAETGSDIFAIKQGCFYKLDGTVQAISFNTNWVVDNYVCSLPIKLNAHDTIHLYARVSPSIPAIIKCDKFGGSRTFVEDGANVTHYEYTASEDCYVMVQYKDTDTFNIASVIPASIKWNWNNDNNDKRHGVVTFIFDDGVEEDEDIVEAFDSHRLCCGFALASSIQSDARVNDYLAWQNRGYSILSHSNDLHDTGDIWNNQETSRSTIINKLLQSKQHLQRAGFDIRGWVTPSSQMAETFRSMLEPLYDYGYTIYYGRYPNSDPVISAMPPYNSFSESPYNMYRIDLMSGAANVKDAIDLAITNKGFLTVYCHAHSMQETHFEDLDDVLDYVEEKIAGYDIKCLAPNEAYDYYFNVRREDIVS